MNEVYLLRSLLNSKDFSIHRQYVNTVYLKENYPEVYKILLSLDSMYLPSIQDNKIPASASVDDLEAVTHLNYPSLKKEEKVIFDELFRRLREIAPSPDTVQTILETHRKRAIASKLATIAWDVSEGRATYADLQKAVLSLPDADSSDILHEDGLVTQDLEQLFQETYAKPGLKWRLKTLRVMMGSLRDGDFGFIFTRPEVGKTTFLCYEGAGLASQLPNDRPLIHFNNEEAGKKIMARYYQAALGLTTKELYANREENQKKFYDYTKGNIRLYDKSTWTKAEIEEICKKYTPGVLFMDSIDKIKGFQDDRDDLVYKQIYQWSRELAKTYGPVIGVCHASVSAEHKKWLEMDDVAYAKTAKQGEADWILGIGAIYEQGKEFLRHLHLPKNKLVGDEDLIEELRHAKLDVRIHPESAQYSDLINWEKLNEDFDTSGSK